MSTDYFKEAIEVILDHEGGYVNDPSDRGGATKFGISQASYPDKDIKNLTKEQAIEIYKRDFWDCAPYRNIVSKPIAIKLIDLAVNIGIQYAMVILQRALRTLHPELSEERKENDFLVNLANAAPEPELLCAIKAEAAGHYRLIGKNNSRFLNGWLNRAYS